MKHIQQQHPMGCGPACIAMLLGITYEQALSYFPNTDWNTRGICYMQADSLLMDSGYAVRRKYRQTHCYEDRPVWPPTPFADRHLCQVKIGQNCHFVVMDGSGLVLDPLRTSPSTLQDYEHVNQVMGLYPVSAFSEV